MKVPFIHPYADIGVATVNKIFAKAGWIFREQPKHDLGIDAHVEIVESSLSTGHLFGVQIKTGHFNRNKNGDLVLYLDREHRSYWLNYSIPVLLTLYDVETDCTYWQIIDTTTVKPTSRGGYKISVPNSNQLTHPTVSEIKVRLFDRISNLVITALRKWVEHRILPEPGEIAYLVKKIQPEKISNELLAFLLCSAHVRREEIEVWSEDNETFSMNHFFCHLHGHSLISINSFKKPSHGLGDLGGGLYFETSKNFIACLLINSYKEGLHIYVLDINEPEIIYKPVLPEKLHEAWKIFDTCINYLEEQKLTDFRKVIGVI